MGLSRAFTSRPAGSRNVHRRLEKQAMNQIAYCRACLIQVALADGPEDQTRLQAFLETWTPGRELKQRSDHCARCGDYGEVSYYDTIEPTE